MMDKVTVVGAGLAGCEAAWQLVKRKIPVRLVEMRPKTSSPAHHSENFAELVCSNSLRSDSLNNAVGILKEEMRHLDSIIMESAKATRVPVSYTHLSMYPTLVEGESVIINMAANYVGEIKRFDVVVAREYRSDDLWVKRVIGLPGETISYREDVLYVDGKAMEEPFLDKKYVEQVKKSANKLYFTQDYTSKKLGKNEYLLVGDNRNESLDSRNDAVGPFQREQIIARGVFVYQPFSKARYVGNGG